MMSNNQIDTNDFGDLICGNPLDGLDVAELDKYFNDDNTLNNIIGICTNDLPPIAQPSNNYYIPGYVNLPDSPPDSSSEPYSPQQISYLNTNNYLNNGNQAIDINNPNKIYETGGQQQQQQRSILKENISNSNANTNKKRKLSTVKPEPIEVDESGIVHNKSYLKFYPKNDANIHQIFDSNRILLPPLSMIIEADKGFIFSELDKSYICQKKNHFQLTIHIEKSANELCYVQINETSLEKIQSFKVDIFGSKLEAQHQIIKIEQSQTDRTKKSFIPPDININNKVACNMTIGRLHFTETTTNNMRKNTKPNPDQRYFILNILLKAYTAKNNDYCVCWQESEKLIVRASNPRQFENDSENTWQKNNDSTSIHHFGTVGINTEKPKETLDVEGNIRLTGKILQPSDERLKEKIEKTDSCEQLKNVKSLKMYKYKYKDNYANSVHMPIDERQTTGVLAQQVQTVLPEAVKVNGDLDLGNGEIVKDTLTVNKDRLCMENIGAVQELCKVADNLQNRIGQLEHFNERLKKKRTSVKSANSSIVSSSDLNTTTDGSRIRRQISKNNRSNANNTNNNNNNNNNVTTNGNVNRNNDNNHYCHRSIDGTNTTNTTMMMAANNRKKKSLSTTAILAGNTCCKSGLLIAIFILVFIMTSCLISITILYVKEKRSPTPFPPQFTGPVVTPATRGSVKPTKLMTTLPTLAKNILIKSYCLEHSCEHKCCLADIFKKENIMNTEKTIYSNSNSIDYSANTITTTTTEKNNNNNNNNNNAIDLTYLQGKPLILYFNRSMDDFCDKESCSDRTGIYRYTVYVHPTIEFGNVYVDLRLNNPEKSSSWLCSYAHASKNDCSGQSITHMPYQDEFNKDIWILPACFFRGPIYKFRVAANNVSNACELSGTLEGINYTSYDFHFIRTQSQECSTKK